MIELMYILQLELDSCISCIDMMGPYQLKELGREPYTAELEKTADSAESFQ